MNEKEKITPIKNSEDLEKLKAKYEQEIEQHKQEALDWKNAAIKSNDIIVEKDKAIGRLETERDDWKKEAHASRRVQQESKQAKETNDFLTELQKLQAKKGIKLDIE
ncbi:MAG: hypothetical protein MRERV_8c051 [Mycoplasmataceae bacterium RV_VA103A]|nr:MAG: hypothetical protein MRERV_29c015 [Mycoplasmataceae bacterium RV_VA103A]KLL04967.1 MAG: hypothetical protein MRERV_8c051 [Mycoplasmataceae bacterium RV_VA103A]